MRIFLVCFLLFFLSVFQTSFLSHVRLAGFSFNAVLLTVVILSLQADLKKSVEAAIAGGLFLDLFSSGFFGQWIIVTLAFALFAHFSIRTYIRTPIFHDQIPVFQAQK